MSVLRQRLADELTKKVRKHGLVVWQDDASEYADVARELVPDGAIFAAFEGSWYALRRQLEDLLAGEQPPNLVVYAPAKPPSNDPLLELRAAGTEFTHRLRTLIDRALEGQLTDIRRTELGRAARTIIEAESALADGAESAGVRLGTVLDSRDAVTMAMRVLDASRDDAIARDGAWESVSEFLEWSFGADATGDGDELRDAFMRHLVLTELDTHLDTIPDSLVAARPQVDAAQRRRSAAVLAELTRPHRLDLLRRLAVRTDEQLALTTVLTWEPSLVGCTATPAIEGVVFDAALGALAGGDAVTASSVAERRLGSSPWARADDPGRWGDKWRALLATARLALVVTETQPPDGAAGELLEWYVADGWRVDRAHRHLEAARSNLPVLGPLDEAITKVRAAYEEWLDESLRQFTSTVATGGWDVTGIEAQGDIHARYVSGEDGPVAYVWVDAMRFELGAELVDALADAVDSVALHAAVAAPPTLTPVGMANLLPGASAGLAIRLDSQGRLVPTMNGHDLPTRKARIDRLRAAHGEVADYDLNQALQQSEKALRHKVADSALTLLTSQEIDAACEKGQLAIAWSQMTAVIGLLANVIVRLGQAGVRRVVVTADHGFLALSRDLADSRVIDLPVGGEGEAHRRAWIGRGGSTPDGTVRVPLSVVGVRSDLDIVVPAGLAVLRAGGDRQFFHGGLSPQELLVPVIVVKTQAKTEPQDLNVDVSIAGGRITTGTFAASLAFHGTLFQTEVTVRVVARAREQHVVARVVSGDGFDPVTGTVTVVTAQSDRPPTMLAFQVTTNLPAASEVEVQVLDARTGRVLASAAAQVAAPVVVEDEL